ncbi:MAG TPA: tetratricopeptide repeat protein [Sphingomicrobium sp.]|nr:tetratricopeptide repeat protein [Sphingomicrobium sp.]
MAAVLTASPAIAAKRPAVPDPGRTYVVARAAEFSGEHGRSAALLAQLAEADSDNKSLNRRAASQAISAGAMALALRLGRQMPADSATTDVRLLLAADELGRGRADRALAYLSSKGDDGDLTFLAPYVRAWAAADRRNLAGALTTLEQVPVNSLLGGYANEQRAYILLKFKMTQDAESFAQRAIAQSARREIQVRLALADGFAAAGDRARALAMLDMPTAEAAAARARIAAGQRLGSAVDTGAKAFGAMLLGLALDLNRANSTSLPVRLVQVARFANPGDSSAAIVLGAMLQQQDRTEEALAAFRSIPPADLLAAQARDAEARALTEGKRFGAALEVARRAANGPTAGSADYSRLGDVLSSMDRHADAAAAYQRALDLAGQGATDRWTLLLLKASSLEAADRWPESKAALEEALKLAPDQPLILNFLGYAKLERGEDLDGAEAMIRKASALAPDDASITDSLGWAQYKRGKIGEAIETLQRAAVADPAQAEIREHLGDALYKAGRKFEARFAWEAALLTSEEDILRRVKSKLESGLNPTNGAP